MTRNRNFRQKLKIDIRTIILLSLYCSICDNLINKPEYNNSKYNQGIFLVFLYIYSADTDVKIVGSSNALGLGVAA